MHGKSWSDFWRFTRQSWTKKILSICSGGSSFPGYIISLVHVDVDCDVDGDDEVSVQWTLSCVLYLIMKSSILHLGVFTPGHYPDWYIKYMFYEEVHLIILHLEI